MLRGMLRVLYGLLLRLVAQDASLLYEGSLVFYGVARDYLAFTTEACNSSQLFHACPLCANVLGGQVVVIVLRGYCLRCHRRGLRSRDVQPGPLPEKRKEESRKWRGKRDESVGYHKGPFTT